MESDLILTYSSCTGGRQHSTRSRHCGELFPSVRPVERYVKPTAAGFIPDLKSVAT